MNLSEEIEAYGQLKGIARFFQDRKMTPDVLLHLEDAPEGCPWFALQNQSCEVAIEQVFTRLKTKMPETVRLLKENCHALFVARAGGRWYLLYLVYMWGSDYYLWVGGEPAENPALSSEIQQAGWVLPSELHGFYRTHHGFGESDTVYAPDFDDRLWSDSCIKPAQRLELLSKQVGGDHATQYNPRDILLFLHDGGSDYFGYAKQTGKIVYYNHDENDLEESTTGDFFQTMDEYFSDMFA